MDGDLRHPPSEQPLYQIAEKHGSEPRSSADNNTAHLRQPKVNIPRRWVVRVWCVVGALLAAYLFSYLIARSDHELRFSLFAVVSVGLVIAACGLAAQIERSREL